MNSPEEEREDAQPCGWSVASSHPRAWLLPENVDLGCLGTREPVQALEHREGKGPLRLRLGAQVGEPSGEGGQHGVGMGIRDRCRGGEDTGLEADLGAQHMAVARWRRRPRPEQGGGGGPLGEPSWPRSRPPSPSPAPTWLC